MSPLEACVAVFLILSVITLLALIILNILKSCSEKGRPVYKSMNQLTKNGGKYK